MVPENRTCSDFEPQPLANLSVHELKPSPENDRVYRPVHGRDPDVLKLAVDIKANGVLEPLVVTLDNYVVSGHRRLHAARLAGLTHVPCRVLPLRREDMLPEDYSKLLVAHNNQRVKTLEEIVREECLQADPGRAYRELREFRQRPSDASHAVPIRGRMSRARISKAKQPMLEAVLHWLNKYQPIWPISNRKVHYLLLNDPPLRHASKPESRYQNDKNSYKDLCDLLTRARLTGELPWDALSDETRPVETWPLHQHAGQYLRSELHALFRRYWRDLQQSQTVHVEIVGEKNTLANEVRPVAQEYCIPFTLGRGYASLDPRKKMFDRMKRSGRDVLVLLVLSDFDPEGEDIAHSFARSMRDDFGIEQVQLHKVALTEQQVNELHLPPASRAKEGSARRKKFVRRHGDSVWELEAVPTEFLQEKLRNAVESVIDMDKFRQEVELEEQEAAQLEEKRNAVIRLMGRAGLSSN